MNSPQPQRSSASHVSDALRPVDLIPRAPEAEVTIPGAFALEPQIAAHELRSSRFLVAISTVTSLVLALVVVLGFQLLRHAVRDARGYTDTPQCVEGEDDRCPEGQTCVARRCVAVAEPKICEIGDLCARDCNAPRSLRCGDEGRYVATRAPSQDICADPKILTFLAKLEKKCGSLRSCEGRQLAEFAIEHDEFLELMTSFPGTAALHFTRGQPSGNFWPPPGSKTQKHYAQGLGPFLNELDRAQTVLLVALSSRDTPKDIPDASKAGFSDQLTLDRAKAAERLIFAALETRGGATEAFDRLDEKLKLVLLGKHKQVDAAFYTDEKVVVRSIAWDDKSERQLRALVEAGDAIDPRLKRWRNSTINQTVFVVPIPCAFGGR